MRSFVPGAYSRLHNRQRSANIGVKLDREKLRQELHRTLWAPRGSAPAAVGVISGLCETAVRLMLSIARPDRRN